MANYNTFRRKSLLVMDLDLDPTNPRIRLRASADHKDCIEQMVNDGDHLLALAKDIAEKGLGLDPIVVEPRDGSWIVRDGNRRVSCLQMLHNPQLAPERIRRRIRRAADAAASPEEVECHVSDDKDAIREHMHRKHSGEGQGEGLRAWKTVEQARWEIDNGYPSSDESAAFIVRYAEDEGLITIPPDLPITTLTRFLNNERLQQLGFDELSTRPPTLNQDESVVVARVQKMIKDLDTKHINVSRSPGEGNLSMMDSQHQEAYLGELLSIGPSAGSAAPGGSGQPANGPDGFHETDSGFRGRTGEEAGAGPPKEETGKGEQADSNKASGGRPQQPSWKRSYVSSPVHVNGVQKLPNHAKKAKAVHDELRRLNVANFPNACAVLVRMFVELSVNDYIARNKIRCNKTELRERVKKSVDHMLDAGTVTPHQASGYKQHTSNESLSTQTLHGFVHQEFLADQQAVNTFWDNMLPFIRHCWHS